MRSRSALANEFIGSRVKTSVVASTVVKGTRIDFRASVSEGAELVTVDTTALVPLGGIEIFAGTELRVAVVGSSDALVFVDARSKESIKTEESRVARGILDEESFRTSASSTRSGRRADHGQIGVKIVSTRVEIRRWIEEFRITIIVFNAVVSGIHGRCTLNSYFRILNKIEIEMFRTCTCDVVSCVATTQTRTRRRVAAICEWAARVGDVTFLDSRTSRKWNSVREL